jgi:holin-like protein
MIRGVFILLLFQLVGEILARGLSLPAPGPVVGLALLVAAMAAYRAWRPYDDEALASSELGRAAAVLLANLSLLFVPAGVGVVQYLSLLEAHGVALAAALIVSTVATLMATVGVFLAVKKAIGLRSDG